MLSLFIKFFKLLKQTSSFNIFGSINRLPMNCKHTSDAILKSPQKNKDLCTTGLREQRKNGFEIFGDRASRCNLPSARTTAMSHALLAALRSAAPDGEHAFKLGEHHDATFERDFTTALLPGIERGAVLGTPESAARCELHQKSELRKQRRHFDSLRTWWLRLFGPLLPGSRR